MMLVTGHKQMIEIRDAHEQVLRFNMIDTGTKL